MMAVCAMCGKRIVVHWPQFYVYKRRDKFFCGANCQEVFDVQETRERIGWMEDWQKRRAFRSPSEPPSDEIHGGQEDRKKMKMFITPENRQKAVEIAIAGGNPLRYLEKCGAKNPSASWSFIKSNVKKNDPELFAKIPEKFGLEVDEHGNVVRKEKKGGPSAVPMPGTRVELDPAELAEEPAPAVSKKEIYEALGVPAELGEAEPARVVQDEKGVHLEPGGTLPRVKMEIDAKDLQAPPDPVVPKAPKVIIAREDQMEDQDRPMGWEVLTMFGIPCEVTGLKIEGFQFFMDSDRDQMCVKWPAEWQPMRMLAGETVMNREMWLKFAEIVPKVLKIFAFGK